VRDELLTIASDWRQVLADDPDMAALSFRRCCEDA
jgi:hypothetical protein